MIKYYCDLKSCNKTVTINTTDISELVLPTPWYSPRQGCFVPYLACCQEHGESIKKIHEQTVLETLTEGDICINGKSRLLFYLGGGKGIGIGQAITLKNGIIDLDIRVPESPGFIFEADIIPAQIKLSPETRNTLEEQYRPLFEADVSRYHRSQTPALLQKIVDLTTLNKQLEKNQTTREQPSLPTQRLIIKQFEKILTPDFLAVMTSSEAYTVKNAAESFYLSLGAKSSIPTLNKLKKNTSICS